MRGKSISLNSPMTRKHCWKLTINLFRSCSLGIAGCSVRCWSELKVDKSTLLRLPYLPSTMLSLSLSSSDTPETAVSGVASSSIDLAADWIRYAAGEPNGLPVRSSWRGPSPVAAELDADEPGRLNTGWFGSFHSMIYLIRVFNFLISLNVFCWYELFWVLVEFFFDQNSNGTNIPSYLKRTLSIRIVLHRVRVPSRAIPQQLSHYIGNLDSSYLVDMNMNGWALSWDNRCVFSRVAVNIYDPQTFDKTWSKNIRWCIWCYRLLKKNLCP